MTDIGFVASTTQNGFAECQRKLIEIALLRVQFSIITWFQEQKG